jgi:Outer membrane protein beta-barrel domain
LRYSHAALALMALSAAPAAAQRPWQPEIGVQLGYSHVKLAGTHVDDAITVIGLPEGNYLPALLSTGSLFAIIPVGTRLAIEPQFTAMQLSGAITAARIGGRLDYAISRGLYAAAGGALNYLSPGSPGHTQVGVQVGVGYRARLTSTLNGRIEANWLSTHSSDLLPAFNTYSVFAGVSSPLNGAGAGRSTRPASARAWTPMVGISGGYVSAYQVGGGGASFSGIFLPGSTNDLTTLGVVDPAPPSLFAVLPIGARWAVEPSFDLHRMSGQGAPDVTGVTAGLRLDYAVHGGWYAAAGGQLASISPPTGSSATILGATLAWGYHFHLAGALGSRFEASYTMSGKNSDLGVPPVNTFGLLAGLTMPLR